MKCSMEVNFKDDRKIVRLEEKGQRFIGNNVSRQTITCYRPDKNLETEACDYFLVCDKDEKGYFIELKGSDLLKAVDQIQSSLDKLHEYYYNLKSVNARIVLSRTNTHDIKSSKLISFKRKIEKLNGDFIRKNIELEENI